MNQQMEFPETFEGFAKEYGFKDEKEVYSNGIDLIPIFRVKQWLEQDNKLRAIETDTAYECGKHANRWIPVSERLPEEGEDVLVCVKGYDSCGHFEDQLWRAPDGSLHISGECKHGECDECKWNLATHFFYCEVAAHFNEPPSSFPDGWSIIDEGDEVIAWMPLPEPYKEQSGTVQLHDPLIDEVVKSGAPFKKWLDSFNTESASVCFNKIQELKGIVGAGSEKKYPGGL